MQHGFRPMVRISVSIPCNYNSSTDSFYSQVVASACGDRTPEIQKANLFDLNAKYADVVSEEEALSEISKGWQ